MTPQRKKEIEYLDIKAYEMAKEICSLVNTQWEADRFIKRIQDNFTWANSRRKPELPDYPINCYGAKIELPGKEQPGNTD